MIESNISETCGRFQNTLNGNDDPFRSRAPDVSLKHRNMPIADREWYASILYVVKRAKTLNG